MRTKKFNQKPLPARWEKHPTMTVTSLPDDYVHYSRPRTFSVREWARLQTFDKHIFCGKRTTGGDRRAGNPSEGNWERENALWEGHLVREFVKSLGIDQSKFIDKTKDEKTFLCVNTLSSTVFNDCRESKFTVLSANFNCS